MKILASLIFFVLWNSPSARAQGGQDSDVINISEEGSATATSASAAKQKIIREVIQNVSIKYVKELIGTTRYEQNAKVIQRKIIDNSGRYIPIIKNSDLIQSGESSHMVVNLEFSLENLRAMLIKEGLMHPSEGPTLILPLIAIADHIQGVTYKWWVDSSLVPEGALRILNQVLTEALRAEFEKTGFYMMDTASWNYRGQMPSFLRKDSIQGTDQAQALELFGSQIVLKGQAILENGDKGGARLQIQITANHGSNGKVLGEVRENLNLNSNLSSSPVDREKVVRASEELAKDLSGQVFETWQKGGVGAHFLTLQVRGGLTFAQLERLKGALQKIRAIRNLKERRFEFGRTTFEVDASATPQQLASQVNSLQSEGFQVKVAEVSSSLLALDVKATAP